MLSLGANIKEYRLRNGYTQEQLAFELGVSSQTISRWETGTTYPDIVMLPIIAELFDVSIDQLMGYSKECSKEEREAFFEKVRHLETSERIKYHRQMLQQYPNDTYLQFYLAGLLYKLVSQREDASIEKELRVLCNRILHSDDASMQCGAKRLLALLSAQNGETQEAMGYVNELPSIYCGREILAEQVLHGGSFRSALERWLKQTGE